MRRGRGEADVLSFMERNDDETEELPGVPGFRSWRAVYAFVFGAFILLVVALTIFARIYA